MVRILVGFGIALALHLLFGWMWSIGGGIALGMYCRCRAWLAGGIAVGLSWALLVAHAFLVAPEPALRLITIMGAMFGDIPGIFIPVITVLIGALLGIAGGLLGASMNPVLAPVWHQMRPRVSSQSSLGRHQEINGSG